MSDQRRTLRFPRVTEATLRRFSLYSLEPEISVRFPDGVFCLVGANGLGKSTFLSAINYAITGIVADPRRKFESVDEYYRYSLEYSSDFFEGRISPNDHDAGEISVTLSIGNRTYALTRGLFEPLMLREFTVRDAQGALLLDTADQTPTERQQEYARRVAEDTGLDSFEQLVFLQHFVLTFDERRQLLLWEPRVLEQTLYLAFAVDQSAPKKADWLRREIEGAASRARNASWQASQVRVRINDIIRAASSVTESATADAEAVGAEHEKLLVEADQWRSEVNSIEGQISDARLKIMELTAKESALRTEYAVEFTHYLAGASTIAQHPLITESIRDKLCGICGATGEGVLQTIELRGHGQDCPLCGSRVEQRAQSAEAVERLSVLDTGISTARSSLEEASKGLNQLTAKSSAAQQRLGALEHELTEFEAANSEALRLLETAGGVSVEPVLATLRKQMEDFLRTKRDQYAKRNGKIAELAKLQRELEVQYAAAEGEFVPLFRNLAHRFLGLELDVRMDARAASGVQLVLEVRGAVRREHHQLSESQRFFMDIALRMALAQYMSDPGSPACLFIDTPEGSLDIAYESRAGDMIARFVLGGHHVLMTANINTSRLLLSLAEMCGRSRMQLCKMTTWAELSDVQIEEEPRFLDAYAQIEAALDRGPND